MAKTAAQLKKSIMRRVWFIWGIRQVLNPVFLKVVLIAVFLWESRANIYYAQVFRNAPEWSDIAQNFAFARSALLHTEPSTVLFVVGGAALAAWLFADILRKKTQAWI